MPGVRDPNATAAIEAHKRVHADTTDAEILALAEALHLSHGYNVAHGVFYLQKTREGLRALDAVEPPAVRVSAPIRVRAQRALT